MRELSGPRHINWVAHVKITSQLQSRLTHLFLPTDLEKMAIFILNGEKLGFSRPLGILKLVQALLEVLLRHICRESIVVTTVKTAGRFEMETE